MSNIYSLSNIVMIVFLQLCLLFFYHFIARKKKAPVNKLGENLELIESIIKSTQHEKIVSIDEIIKVELASDEVFVFSKDIYRDIKNEGQFSEKLFGISTFYETVKINLENKTKYKYFLKKDTSFRHSLFSFLKSHGENDEVDFYIIPSDKFFFYNEVYLYKTEGEMKAFEHLPSISSEEEGTLYYMELDEAQTERLNVIKNNMISAYSETSLRYMSEIKNLLIL